jgi:hypothetical protein
MVEYWVKDIYSSISLVGFVIPGLTKPAPYLIRGNPVIKTLVPCFRRDDVWIPAFAGMTFFPEIKVALCKNPTFHHSNIPSFRFIIP